jgi:hypothetical protein
VISASRVVNLDTNSIVLVHCGFVYGSGWQRVNHRLRQDGFTVGIVQNPTLSLEGDAELTGRILHRQDGPTALVGHSHGGTVIREAGTHPAVSGAALRCPDFARGKGESVLSADPPPVAPGPADPRALGRLSVPRPGHGRRLLRQ